MQILTPLAITSGLLACVLKNMCTNLYECEEVEVQQHQAATVRPLSRALNLNMLGFVKKSNSINHNG